MEIASIPFNQELTANIHKPSKKQAKMIQQRLERMAMINIHLQGKQDTFENKILTPTNTTNFYDNGNLYAHIYLEILNHVISFFL